MDGALELWYEKTEPGRPESDGVRERDPSPDLKPYRFGCGYDGGGFIEAEDGIRLLLRFLEKVMMDAEDVIEAMEPRRRMAWSGTSSCGGFEDNGDGITSSTRRSCRAILLSPAMVGSAGATASATSSSYGKSGKQVGGRLRKWSTTSV
jgi:hypothetical protein